MTTSNLLTILIFSTLAALAGLLFLRIAIRGKLISPNPHCRKCKFDLIGLDLTDPTPCPECGTTLRTNTPAITPGLRKKRKLALLASILFLLTAATGLAWPKLSTLPSIQNINIYNHFPESLLTKLATTGDQKALQTLHDRLIPGQVSDNALQKLIGHAFKLQADESVPWDQFWGDVIVYGVENGAVDNETLGKLVEGSTVHFIVAHERVGPSSDTLSYQINARSTRGEGTYQFRRNLYGGHETHWDLSMRVYRVLTDDSKVSRHGYMGTGSQYWFPFQMVGAFGSKIPIPADQDRITFRFPIEYVLSKEGVEIYRWDTELRHDVERLDSEAKYIEIESDQTVGSELIENLFISELMVPTEVVGMAKHNSIRSVSFAFAEIEHSIAEGLSLMGTINYRIDDQEIAGPSIISSLDSGYRLEIWPQYHDEEAGWLKPYIDQAEFWEKAVERGMIDVIYRPDPSLAEMNPGYKKMLGIPFIFEDVPVKVMIPEQVSSNRAGTQGMEWRYINRFSIPAPPKTGASELDD